MTRALPITELFIRRAIAAVRKERLPIKAVTVRPDGSVTMHQEEVVRTIDSVLACSRRAR